MYYKTSQQENKTGEEKNLIENTWDNLNKSRKEKFMKDADPKIDHFDFNEENLLKFNDTRNHSFKN